MPARAKNQHYQPLQVDYRGAGKWSKDQELTITEAKAAVLDHIAKGYTVQQACDAAGRHIKTYESWRAQDKGFAAAVDRVRLHRRGEIVIGPEMPFADFSEKFFGARVFPHMQNVVDVIEGREPSWRPQGIVWESGEPDLVIVNMPPEHGKTMTLSINYLTYRICMDPNIRILLVSKTIGMARKILSAVKDRLTHPKYADMIAAYGPPGGFDHNSASWTQDKIYISGDVRDPGEKDPTIEALGIRGHIYGARADLILMDDCVDLTNAHEYDKQMYWIQTEVMSRIAADGLLLAIGTRLASRDLYGELQNPANYPDDTSPWSYLAMPAVLEFADEPADWKCLWPRSNMPEVTRKTRQQPDADGLYPKWDGTRLVRKRARMTPQAWARVYQQQQTSETDVFQLEAVKAAINSSRQTGLMPKNYPGCRPGGMDGLIVMAGLDPASPSGFVAAVVVGLDPSSQKRYVLDVWNQTGMTPDDIRELIKNWTVRYNISEWRIEKNAFQTMLTQDREVNNFLRHRGSVLREHHTGKYNKWDADFGVASMTTLFGGWERGEQLIELPGTHNSNASKQLVEQLVTWMPDAPRRQRTDIVMALWFVELACRDRMALIQSTFTRPGTNPFLTRYDMSRQYTVNIHELEQIGA